MGLDMWIYKQIKDNLGKREEIAYWENANQIRTWISSHVSNFEDSGRTKLDVIDLNSLLDTCELVLEKPEHTRKLLPTTQNKLFGNAEYNEQYFENIEKTITIINKVLSTVNFHSEDIMYTEWY